jgi:hypothetical protein
MEQLLEDWNKDAIKAEDRRRLFFCIPVKTKVEFLK